MSPFCFLPDGVAPWSSKLSNPFLSVSLPAPVEELSGCSEKTPRFWPKLCIAQGPQDWSRIPGKQATALWLQFMMLAGLLYPFLF